LFEGGSMSRPPRAENFVMKQLANLKSPCPTDAIIFDEGKQAGKVILRIDE
jgi:hypothetical protein